MSILISNKGRYKYTGVYSSADGALYGTWMAPDALDSKVPNRGQIHILASSEVGFLDKVAARYYGDGGEMLWWALCRANGITDPETDTYAGMRLYVPDRATVDEYVRQS
jgi:hypothetical protein